MATVHILATPPLLSQTSRTAPHRLLAVMQTQNSKGRQIFSGTKFKNLDSTFLRIVASRLAQSFRPIGAEIKYRPSIFEIRLPSRRNAKHTRYIYRCQKSTNGVVVGNSSTLGVVRVGRRRRRKSLRHREKRPDRQYGVGDKTGSRNMAVITATCESTSSPYSTPIPRSGLSAAISTVSVKPEVLLSDVGRSSRWL